jgi:hypothetical protein
MSIWLFNAIMAIWPYSQMWIIWVFSETAIKMWQSGEGGEEGRAKL